ncbi:MAG: SDR family NAD(P)-dependent oxidoreductase, partial [Schaedlerella sp.]
MGLKGKTALVTGGSKGIGAGICSVLAGEGCNLVINYRSDVNKAMSLIHISYPTRTINRS